MSKSQNYEGLFTKNRRNSAQGKQEARLQLKLSNEGAPNMEVACTSKEALMSRQLESRWFIQLQVGEMDFYINLPRPKESNQAGEVSAGRREPP